MNSLLIRTALIAAATILLASIHSAAADTTSEPSAETTARGTVDSATAPVIIDGVELFPVLGISAYPAPRRAREIAARIEALAADPAFDPGTLSVVAGEDRSTIVANGRRMVTVFDADPRPDGLDREVLAQTYLLRIREAIAAYRHDRTPEFLLRQGLAVAAASLVLAIFLWGGGWAIRRIDAVLDRRIRERLEGLESQSYRLVRASHVWNTLKGLRHLVWMAAILVASLAYLQFVLGSLPWTRAIGNRLLAILIEPLRVIGVGMVEAIPNLAFILVLLFVVRYVLKALQVFFRGVAEQAIVLRDFDADWAWPTYRIVKLFVIAFAAVVAFPYIPGSSSEAFKGVSIFLGVVFSLGSTSVIANILAGYGMIYRRGFKLGDRVRIGEHFGDVTAVRLLGTHMRTPKNEEIVLPNALILGSSVVNYSTYARRGELILHATVGIGYETAWRQVEAMLLQAAARTEGLLAEPKPFVLVKALGDFAVTYEINASCADAHAMNRLYTLLHQNILDVFNEYGVQIMTPAYEGDPEQPKLVPKERWFDAPAQPPDQTPGSQA